MKASELRESLRQSPFRPFDICIADGRRFHVNHPEFAIQSPGGQTVIVFTSEDTWDIIDVPLITSLSFGNGKGSGNGKSRKSKG